MKAFVSVSFFLIYDTCTHFMSQLLLLFTLNEEIAQVVDRYHPSQYGDIEETYYYRSPIDYIPEAYDYCLL